MGQGASRDRNQTWEVDAISDHQPRPGEHCSINAMQKSDDSSILVTGGEDCTARIWDLSKPAPKCIGKLRGHKEYITQICVIGTKVITGSADNTIRKWDMFDVSCEYVYEGHSQRIQRLICTSDFILSSSTDKTCMLWRMKLPNTGGRRGDVYDGRERSADDPIDEQWIRTFRGHTATVYALCFVPGDLLQPPPQNRDKENGDDSAEPSEQEQEQQVVKEPETEDRDEDGIHPKDILITGSGDTTARSWSLATGQQIKVFKGHRGAVMLMAVDEAGQLLYTAGDDKDVRQWNIKRGICTMVISGHGDSVSSILLIESRRSGEGRLYTGSADFKARSFNTEFGDCVRSYGPHRDTVNTLRYNGGILFTGCTDSVARAYDAISGRLLRCYVGHEAAITCMELAKNRLYTGSDDGILRVWDAQVTPEAESQIQKIDQSAKTVEDAGSGAPAEGAAETAAE